MFCKLSWEAIPFHEPIVMITIAMIALGGLAVFAAITYFKKWTYLWTEWLTSVDHHSLFGGHWRAVNRPGSCPGVPANHRHLPVGEEHQRRIVLKGVGAAQNEAVGFRRQGIGKCLCTPGR